MNLIQIRYFLTLAETLNFTRAAAACNVTQPALTKSIRKLEEEFGGPLVLRERAHSQLTELGAAMVPLLQQTYEAATAARRGAARFHQQDRLWLRVALGPWVPPETLVPLLKDLDASFPKLEITLRQGNTPALNDWLMASEVDAVFTTDVDGLSRRAMSWKLFDEAMAILLHPDHPLADRPLSLELLKGQLCIARADPTDAALDDGPGSVQTAHLHHVGSTEEHIWALVRAGRGVAVSTARRWAPPDILIRPLEPARLLGVHVAMLPGRRRSRAVSAFLRLARSRDWSGALV